MPHKRAKRAVREKQRTQSSLNLPPGVRSSIDNEDIPKGAARILNAAKVQEEFRNKKRKQPDDSITDHDGSREAIIRKKRRKDDKGGGASGSAEERKGDIKIQPGESMAHFNRRVEDSMRGAVRIAMKNSSARLRKAKKDEAVTGPAKPPQVSTSAKRPQDASPEVTYDVPEAKPAHRSDERETRPKDFEHLSSSAPKRLNDIVQAPPELNKVPRGAKRRVQLADAPKGEKTLRQGVLSMAQKASLEEERTRAIKMYREMKKAKIGG